MGPAPDRSRWLREIERLKKQLERTRPPPAAYRIRLRIADLYRMLGELHTAAWWYLDYARWAERDGLLLEAAAVARQLLQLVPDHGEARVLLARVYRAVGLEDEAFQLETGRAQRRVTLTPVPSPQHDPDGPPLAAAWGPCALCEARSPAFDLKGMHAGLCEPCPGRIATAFLDGPLRSLWMLPEPESEPRAREGRDDLPDAVATAVDDAEVHLDLSIAYRDMGLLRDSALEAAEALRRSPSQQAVDLLFERATLGPLLLRRIRQILEPS